MIDTGLKYMMAMFLFGVVVVGGGDDVGAHDVGTRLNMDGTYVYIAHYYVCVG